MWNFFVRMKSIAVDDNEFRYHGQLFDGLVHGKDSGIENVDIVYSLRMHKRDPEAGAARFDERFKKTPAFVREQF